MLKYKQKQQEEQLTCERSGKKYFWFGDLGLEGFELGEIVVLVRVRGVFLWRGVFLFFNFVPLKQNTCACHVHESTI